MNKITRMIHGEEVEIELTEEEIASIRKKYHGWNDGKEVWLCSIKEASNIIAHSFIDKVRTVFMYTIESDLVDDIEEFDETLVNPYVVTTDFKSNWLHTDKYNDYIALCNYKDGGNFSSAYVWGDDYTLDELFAEFADRICNAMCDSCGQDKEDIIYLKAGEFND